MTLVPVFFFFRNLFRFWRECKRGWLLPKPENTQKPLVRTSPEVCQIVIGQARTFECASLATELAAEYSTRAREYKWRRPVPLIVALDAANHEQTIATSIKVPAREEIIHGNSRTRVAVFFLYSFTFYAIKNSVNMGHVSLSVPCICLNPAPFFLLLFGLVPVWCSCSPGCALHDSTSLTFVFFFSSRFF